MPCVEYANFTGGAAPAPDPVAAVDAIVAKRRRDGATVSYHRAMPTNDRPSRPTRPPVPDDFDARFAWHPEPELLGVRDAATSREALRTLGTATWEAGLDYLYDHGLERAMGPDTEFAALRGRYFGQSGEPGPAPMEPTALPALLGEFRERIAPNTVSAWHPRSYGYFTPPPLIASIVGEVLSQFAQQGVDIFHAGPIAATMEEEVVRWLCDLLGYDRASFGLLTSGGVMANFIGMTLMRDAHVPKVMHLDRPPRGAALEGLRVYTGDQSHFSIGRALDELGFPIDTLVTVPADDDFRLRASGVSAAIDADRARGLTPIAIAAVAGATNTGAVDAIGELADLAAREGLWLHVDAAYGAGALLSTRDAGRVPDLHRADSVTVDPHKWFFQAYDIGGLMVRDGAALEAVFGERRPEYYRAGHGSMAPSPGAAAPASTAARPQRDRRSARRRPELLEARVRGHPALARAQAVVLVAAPGHPRFRPTDRGQQRPRGPSRRGHRGERRLRGAPRRPEPVGRLFPAPRPGARR